MSKLGSEPCLLDYSPYAQGPPHAMYTRSVRSQLTGKQAQRPRRPPGLRPPWRPLPRPPLAPDPLPRPPGGPPRPGPPRPGPLPLLPQKSLPCDALRPAHALRCAPAVPSASQAPEPPALRARVFFTCPRSYSSSQSSRSRLRGASALEASTRRFFKGGVAKTLAPRRHAASRLQRSADC